MHIFHSLLPLLSLLSLLSLVQSSQPQINIPALITTRPWEIHRTFTDKELIRAPPKPSKRPFLSRLLSPSPPKLQTPTLVLSQDRTARFSSGEQGRWGLKAGPNKSFVYLSVEVPIPNENNDEEEAASKILVYTFPVTNGKFQKNNSIDVLPGKIERLSSGASLKGEAVGNCNMHVQGAKPGEGGSMDKGGERGRKVWWSDVCNDAD